LFKNVVSILFTGLPITITKTANTLARTSPCSDHRLLDSVNCTQKNAKHAPCTSPCQTLVSLKLHMVGLKYTLRTLRHILNNLDSRFEQSVLLMIVGFCNLSFCHCCRQCHLLILCFQHEHFLWNLECFWRLWHEFCPFAGSFWFWLALLVKERIWAAQAQYVCCSDSTEKTSCARILNVNRPQWQKSELPELKLGNFHVSIQDLKHLGNISVNL